MMNMIKVTNQSNEEEQGAKKSQDEPKVRNQEQKRMNTINITTIKLGPHLMMITKRRTIMEERFRPTLEYLSDEDYDESLLKSIVVCGVV